jgi:hypothetical protein
MKTIKKILGVLLLCNLALLLKADGIDEWKIKRQEIFEFSKTPTVTRKGDTITIKFETKAFCDVSVAIENNEGKIVRHLISGVLGPKAPEPFQKDTKEQTLVWDSKNDKGEYVVDKDNLNIRVSLGLKAKYEKSLFWDPKKRVSAGMTGESCTEDPIPVPTPEGVYVYDGNGTDHVRLFDHKGNYIRTIYPFPADKIKEVKGLEWLDYPQGYTRPKKYGLNQTSFYNTGGVNGYSFLQASAYTMAVQGNRIALAKLKLGRLGTDGTSAGFNLNGPRTYFNLQLTKDQNNFYGPQKSESRCCPYSSAFSPDGKKVYMAGYSVYTTTLTGQPSKKWLGGVAVIDYEGETEAKIFTGDLIFNSGFNPGVACDAKGNVYVTDYINDLITVYDKEAKIIKTIPAKKPTLINVNPKTGEICVFSWFLGGLNWELHPELKKQKDVNVPSTIKIYKSLEDPSLISTFVLPIGPVKYRDYWGDTGGTVVRAAMDFWADEPTVWFISGPPKNTNIHERSIPLEFGGSGWLASNMQLLQLKDGKATPVREFGKEIATAIKRLSVNMGHQKIYINPSNQKLYFTHKEVNVGGGEFKSVCEITPDTGVIKEIPIPLMSAEDMAFDIDGNIYLRQVKPQRVTRFAIGEPWRQIPWDYGAEGKDGNDGKMDLLSSLILPAWSTVCQSEGGMWVSPKGNLAVSCSVKSSGGSAYASLVRDHVKLGSNTEYAPPMFPGRQANPANATLQVWDKYGKVIYEDAVPGMSQVDGVGIDKDDNIYVMSCIPRVNDGKKYFNWLTGTVIKVKPKKNKWVSSDESVQIPIPKDQIPKRSPDISGYGMGDLYIEGAEWFYGGVGNCSLKIATGCICWQQSRFTIDYYARSFAPEMDQFSVAVLDASGNLIMRIGQYGNVDDGLPPPNAIAISQKPDKPITGPTLVSPNPRSIGGDEVALMHGCHVATMTDKYLYISDTGNSRIVQVKLSYHVEEKVSMKNVREQ